VIEAGTRADSLGYTGYATHKAFYLLADINLGRVIRPLRSRT